MNIRTAVVFAAADWLALHLQNKGSNSGRVSEMQFKSLKSRRDSSRQYSLKKMHPRQLFLGRVSIVTGVRDSTTNTNKGFKGFRPQLSCPKPLKQPTRQLLYLPWGSRYRVSNRRQRRCAGALWGQRVDLPGAAGPDTFGSMGCFSAMSRA